MIFALPKPSWDPLSPRRDRFIPWLKTWTFARNYRWRKTSSPRCATLITRDASIKRDRLSCNVRYTRHLTNDCARKPFPEDPRGRAHAHGNGGRDRGAVGPSLRLCVLA